MIFIGKINGNCWNVFSVQIFKIFIRYVTVKRRRSVKLDWLVSNHLNNKKCECSLECSAWGPYLRPSHREKESNFRKVFIFGMTFSTAVRLFFPRFTLKTFARIVLYYKWFINKKRKKVRGLTNIWERKKKYIDTTHIHIYTLFGSLFYLYLWQ